jgi:FK506-binding protein 2
VDATIGSKEVASAEKVDPDSLAAKSGVKPGMVLLGRDSATKSSSKNIEFRLRNGPFPFILQFATPEEMMKLTSSNSGQQQVQERALGPYDRLDVKTVQTPNTCDNKAKTGDTVTISYEARISTATGPIYDSTAWRQSDPATFVLGKGVALPGVEIGLNGICVGEVREIDIPTSLGYGKFGSQVVDVPGDVRLWWRVELLDLTKNQKKFGCFNKSISLQRFVATLLIKPSTRYSNHHQLLN